MTTKPLHKHKQEIQGELVEMLDAIKIAINANDNIETRDKPYTIEDNAKVSYEINAIRLAANRAYYLAEQYHPDQVRKGKKTLRKPLNLIFKKAVPTYKNKAKLQAAGYHWETCDEGYEICFYTKNEPTNTEVFYMMFHDNVENIVSAQGENIFANDLRTNKVKEYLIEGDSAKFSRSYDG